MVAERSWFHEEDQQNRAEAAGHSGTEKGRCLCPRIKGYRAADAFRFRTGKLLQHPDPKKS